MKTDGKREQENNKNIHEHIMKENETEMTKREQNRTRNEQIMKETGKSKEQSKNTKKTWKI